MFGGTACVAITIAFILKFLTQKIVLQYKFNIVFCIMDKKFIPKTVKQSFYPLDN